ncbi:MAG: FkbM family methyltransferase [Ruminococcus sp.]|nr:FkbM family methyltransferase [Ruminococcus sp.]
MLCIDEFFSLKSSWERLVLTDKPIYVYGMGDGCIKLMKQFERFGIKIAGIFASDEFVRGHSFLDFKVQKLSEVEAQNDDFVIALAFAAGYKELIEKIDSIAKKHELIVPDTAVYGGEPFLKETLESSFDKASVVYEHLSDEKSRSVFKSVVKYKITGDISFLKSCETTPEEAYLNILKPSGDEVYVDLGAYTGDTVKEYLTFAKSYKRIYAVEPNGRNFRKLSEYMSTLDKAEAVNAAATDTSGKVYFAKGGGRQARIDDKKGVLTDAISVDSLLMGKPVDFIKYDVEGEEMKALKGSEQTIKNYSPKLCVALYHKLYDMFDLPLEVLRLNPDYKLYIRHYPYYPAWETNLFAKI